MIKRTSYLNGCLENEIDIFADMLFVEFGFDVKQIELYYYDDSECENVHHLFFRGDCKSNCILE